MAVDRSMCDALDALCPLHVQLDDEERIVHVGPTMARLRPAAGLVGQPFTQVFDLRLPRRGAGAARGPGLLGLAGRRLRVSFRTPPATTLKGIVVPHPAGRGAIVNFGFGISLIDAVREYGLSSHDFAPTDLAIEMLYLVEAKSAAMESSRQLNRRLQGAMIRAEEQAYTDTLTGLKNRRALEHVLGQYLELGQSFALMHVDLDFFKAVNDTHGHAAGDHVLRTVAIIMRETTREDDLVARVGGDEFILLLPGLTERARLAEVAQRLIARIEEPINCRGVVCRVSASIGIAISTESTTHDAERLIEDADLALYQSKREGRGRFSFYGPHLRQEEAGSDGCGHAAAGSERTGAPSAPDGAESGNLRRPA